MEGKNDRKQNIEKKNVIHIQYCTNCQSHNWNTHHNEAKYHQTFIKLKNLIEQFFKQHAPIVIGNKVPNYLLPIKQQQNKFYNQVSKKYVFFPNVGSFEVTLNGELVFSKKKTNTWPNFQTVLNDLSMKILQKPLPKVEQPKIRVQTSHEDQLQSQSEKMASYQKSKTVYNQQNNNSGKKFGGKFTLTDHFKTFHQQNFPKVKPDSYNFDSSSTIKQVQVINKIDVGDIQGLRKALNTPSTLNKNKINSQNDNEILVDLSSIQEQGNRNQLSPFQMMSVHKKTSAFMNNQLDPIVSLNASEKQMSLKRFQDISKDLMNFEKRFQKMERKIIFKGQANQQNNPHQTGEQKQEKQEYQSFSTSKYLQQLQQAISKSRMTQKQIIESGKSSMVKELFFNPLEGSQVKATDRYDERYISPTYYEQHELYKNYKSKKLSEIEEYLKASNEEKNKKLKKIYGEWKAGPNDINYISYLEKSKKGLFRDSTNSSGQQLPKRRYKKNKRSDHSESSQSQQKSSSLSQQKQKQESSEQEISHKKFKKSNQLKKNINKNIINIEQSRKDFKKQSSFIIKHKSVCSMPRNPSKQNLALFNQNKQKNKANLQRQSQKQSRVNKFSFIQMKKKEQKPPSSKNSRSLHSRNEQKRFIEQVDRQKYKKLQNPVQTLKNTLKKVYSKKEMKFQSSNSKQFQRSFDNVEKKYDDVQNDRKVSQDNIFQRKIDKIKKTKLKQEKKDEELIKVQMEVKNDEMNSSQGQTGKQVKQLNNTDQRQQSQPKIKEKEKQQVLLQTKVVSNVKEQNKSEQPQKSDAKIQLNQQKIAQQDNEKILTCQKIGQENEQKNINHNDQQKENLIKKQKQQTNEQRQKVEQKNNQQTPKNSLHNSPQKNHFQERNNEKKSSSQSEQDSQKQSGQSSQAQFQKREDLKENDNQEQSNGKISTPQTLQQNKEYQKNQQGQTTNNKDQNAKSNYKIQNIIKRQSRDTKHKQKQSIFEKNQQKTKPNPNIQKKNQNKIHRASTQSIKVVNQLSKTKSQSINQKALSQPKKISQISNNQIKKTEVKRDSKSSLPSKYVQKRLSNVQNETSVNKQIQTKNMRSVSLLSQTNQRQVSKSNSINKAHSYFKVEKQNKRNSSGSERQKASNNEKYQSQKDQNKLKTEQLKKKDIVIQEKPVSKLELNSVAIQTMKEEELNKYTSYFQGEKIPSKRGNRSHRTQKSNSIHNRNSVLNSPRSSKNSHRQSIQSMRKNEMIKSIYSPTKIKNGKSKKEKSLSQFYRSQSFSQQRQTIEKKSRMRNQAHDSDSGSSSDDNQVEIKEEYQVMENYQRKAKYIKNVFSNQQGDLNEDQQQVNQNQQNEQQKVTINSQRQKALILKQLYNMDQILEEEQKEYETIYSQNGIYFVRNSENQKVLSKQSYLFEDIQNLELYHCVNINKKSNYFFVPIEKVVSNRMENKLQQKKLSLFNPQCIEIQKVKSNFPYATKNLVKILHILASKNELLIARLFEDYKSETNFYHRVNGKQVLISKRVYGVWLCVNKSWKLITVDNIVPAKFDETQTQQKFEPTFLYHSSNQLWPIILEKCLAKAVGGYNKLFQLTVGELFSLMTGSNYLSYSINENISKNKSFIREISENDKKNFIMVCEKHPANLKEENLKTIQQPKLFYLLSKKIVNNNQQKEQILFKIKQVSTSSLSAEQPYYMRYDIFCENFKHCQVLHLRQHHNFTCITLNKGNISTRSGKVQEGTYFNVVELVFEDQSFGSITVSNEIKSDLKTFLYKLQNSDNQIMKLVGQASKSNKKELFFDCFFQSQKYYLFIQSSNPNSIVSYMGENKPEMKIKQKILTNGLRNKSIEYLPVSSIDQIRSPQKLMGRTSQSYFNHQQQFEQSFGKKPQSMQDLREMFIGILMQEKRNN